MSENNSTEIWQIDVNGQIYEAPFNEMAQWIAEGSLLRGDKVRKGSLRWIEAGRVPTLVTFFNAKDSGNPILPVVSTTVEEPQNASFHSPVENFPVAAPPESFTPTQGFSNETFYDAPQSVLPPPPPAFESPGVGVCAMHPDAPASYLCETCGSSLCKACPNSYGGSVKICPFCGAMCKNLEALQQAREQEARYEFAVSEGFGIADFGRALAYPFKFKASLIIGAIMFALFSYGQSASAMGGFMLMAASIFCMMGANMLTFGILSNTVDNFSQGKIGHNFMPNFDGFSLWEDVVHPFFMSIAVYLVSFGACAALIIGLIWYSVNTITSAAPVLEQKSINTVMPGSQGDLNSAKQIPQIDRLRTQIDQNNRWADGEMPTDEEIINGQSPAGFPDTEETVMQAEELIQKQRKAQAESVVGKAPEEERAMYGQMVSGFVAKAGIFMVLIALAFIWGIFYFPAACAVAGYTQSFMATINPSVGLDTIRRLGVSYVKILLMGLTIVVMSVIISTFLHLLFLPFEIPKMGNLPANIIGSFISFYFAIVFSCVIGFALFKNSDKLKLFRG